MTGDLVFGMAGSGGDGIVSAGESLLAAAAAGGWFGMMTKSFGSQIRGGESSCRVRLATKPVLNPGGTLDVAVALNWDDFLKFGAELPVGGGTVVIHEAADTAPADRLPLLGVSPAEIVEVPIEDISRRITGDVRAKSTVVLGLLAGWFGVGRDSIPAAIRRKLAKKGADVVEANARAFAAGMAFAAEHPLARARTLAPPPAGGVKFLADGNEICAAAAIFAGCDFFGGYPITPSSEIMHFLADHLWKHGGAVLQAEDEIAGIGAALGASFAGRKAMTATSGPGLSLKSEIMGLATIAELPLVIVDVQRGGPSTGMPTKTEQSDLFAAVFSAHGDAVRPVLAPQGVADTFRITVEAFNIAEEFQTPVIVLSDQEIAQRKETVEPFDTASFRIAGRRRPAPDDLEDYARFRITGDGVSPISHPGMKGGNYLGSGIEHDERGSPTANGTVHHRMNDKRIRKLDPILERADLFEVDGDPAAPLALVSWGSTAGVCREALAIARAEGLQVKLLVPSLLFPVAERSYRAFFRNVLGGLVVEQSWQGQLHRLLRMYDAVPPAIESFCRSGANPFQPAEIVQRLRDVLRRVQDRLEPVRQPQE